MTARRLRVLLQKLPPESHTMTALRNELEPEEISEQAETGEPEKGRWSQMELLVAGNNDVLRRIEYVLICAHSEKKNPVPPPEPMRRPGAGPKPAKKPLTEANANRLLQLINGGRED